MRRAILIISPVLERLKIKRRDLLLYEFLFGALAGVCLAFAFKPTEYRFLAFFSTLILGWRIKSIVANGYLQKQILQLMLGFLFFSRLLYFRNDYFLLMNKVKVAGPVYLPIFIMMILQIVIPSLVLVLVCHFLLKKWLRSENLFLSLFLTFVLIDLGSYWTIPTTPVIPLGNTLKWAGLFTFWGHLGVSLFYYALMSSLLLNFKNRIILVSIFAFSFLAPWPFLKKQFLEKDIQLITINQKFSIVNQDNTFQPNPLLYIEQLSNALAKDRNLNNPIFLWNEAAIIQLPQNKKIIENIKLNVVQKLPFAHFIGNIELKQGDNIMQGNSRYDLVGDASSKTFHQKKYLVPIDESLNYFPWLPKQFYLNPLSIESGNQMGVLKTQGIRFGILLCNEVAEILKLSMSHYFAKVDVILNPSNVPDLYENSYEDFLDEHAQWISLVTGKPVIRSSNSGRVKMFYRENIKDDFTSYLNSKKINLSF